jgi:uncharacterized Zn-binding protein involved in type VI secretion
MVLSDDTISWFYEINGGTYDGNLVIDVGRPIVIKGDQTVKGNQTVRGRLIVECDQRVEGYQIVEGDQRVEGNQRVEGEQRVQGDQIVEGNQIVKGDQIVQGDQIVKGNQIVQGEQRVEGRQSVAYKYITGHCKWLVKYSHTKIHIGCKEKTTSEWDKWFAGTHEYHTKRGTDEFKQIYKTYLMAKVAQKHDCGLMRKDGVE